MSNNTFALLFTGSGFIIGFFTALLLVYARRAKRRNLVATHSKAIYMQMQGRAQRPNTERNILGDLRRLNPERCKAFGHSVENMPITFWATAVAGETGELCNLIKKMERGDTITFIKDKLGAEAADIVIYLDLLTYALKIDLQAAIVQKFNEVSNRVNSPIKL